MSEATRAADATAVHAAWGEVAASDAAGHESRIVSVPGGERADLLAALGRDDSGEHPIAVLARRLAVAVRHDHELLTDRERRLFEEHLIGDLGEVLRQRQLDAADLVASMKQLLSGVTTSQGISVRLTCSLRDDVDDDAQRAVELLGQPVGALLPDAGGAARRVAAADPCLASAATVHRIRSSADAVRSGQVVQHGTLRVGRADASLRFAGEQHHGEGRRDQPPPVLMLNRLALSALLDLTDADIPPDALSYARGGRVQHLQVRPTTATARVIGSHPYRVELAIEDGELTWDCSCPVLGLCKHALAVALLWRDNGLGDEPQRPSLADAVAGLGRDDLVELLLAAAAKDGRLADVVLDRAGMLSPPGSTDIASMRRSIDLSFDDTPMGPWETREYRDIVDDVLEGLRELVERLPTPQVVELVEHAMRRWDFALGHIDDSWGHLSGTQEELTELHQQVCRAACPEPLGLARRLLDMQLQAGFDMCFHAPAGYEEALGAAGLHAYDAAVRELLDELPAAGPKDESGYDHRRRTVIRLAVDRAEAGGDIDGVVHALAKDLSQPYAYRRIAVALREAGRPTEAARWAREGLAAFGVDLPLLDELLTSLEPAEAAGEARRRFEQSPSFDTYQRLATHCRDRPQWTTSRTEALNVLRRKRAAAPERRPQWGPHPGDEVVRTLLWEQSDDEAWDEATGHGCSHELWVRLAQSREREHPLDAVPIFQRQAEQQIEVRKNEAYAAAAATIRHVGELLERGGRGGDVSAYVADVRQRHKPKRNLMKAMSQAGLG